MADLATPTAPTDVGEAGQMKKRLDAPQAKLAWFQPTQIKTKIETKLEFFGFEDQEGEEGFGLECRAATGHSSSYKINYFGFDDLSESDSNDESTQAKEKKEAAAVLGTSPQTSSNTDKQMSVQKVVKDSKTSHRSTPDSNLKPTTLVSYNTKTTASDDWNSVKIQRLSSALSMDSIILGKDSNVGSVGSRDSQSSTSAEDELYTEGLKSMEQKPPAEPPAADNCRKYHWPGRPNKASSDTVASSSQPPRAVSPKVYSVSAAGTTCNAIVNTSNTATKPAAAAKLAPAAVLGVKGVQSRWDYTELHRPPCRSLVTQDCSMGDLATPVAPTYVGEAGQVKKKSDALQAKRTRGRPTQIKTKKETKLEFFGFEDKEDQEGVEGLGLKGGAAVGHSSSYKIKYFGFDDLSESDSNDESTQAKEKKEAAAVLDTSMDSPQTSSNTDQSVESSLQVQMSSPAWTVSIKREPEDHLKQEPEDHLKQEPEDRLEQEPKVHIKQEPEDHRDTNAFDFSDDCSPGVSDVQKGRSGRPNDKSKDAGPKQIFSGPKKIFSGPKKMTTGRGPWYQEMVSKRYSTLSEYQKEMYQGCGLFDAMMQPVVKLYRIDHHRERSTVSREIKRYSTLSEEQREMDKRRGPFNAMLQPVVKLYRMEFLHLRCKEEIPPEKRSTRLVQEESESPYIKDEREELLQKPEMADGSTQTLLIAKGEDGGKNRKTEPVASTSTQHMKTQADVDKKMLSCTECGETFHFKGQLKNHTMIHTWEKPLTCKVCGKGFSGNGALKIHTRSHTGERPFTCKVCGKGFITKGHLKTHTMIHTGEKPFTCKVCGKGFNGSGALKMHTRSHTGERPFTCKVCGKGFIQTGHLKQHMIWSHTEKKRFSCTECGKLFKFKVNLKDHIMIHTGEKPFTCQVCGKGFSQKAALKKHVITHTEEKPFTCTVCGKGFIRKESIQIHMRTHTGEHPFKCEDCGKGFRDRDHLRAHVRTHTGERPFTCGICGKGFSRAGVVKTHMRCHTGEKPFTCLVCGTGFAHSNMLKQHIRTHTGEKPFSCTVCGKSFRLMQQLKIHMRTHTGERPFSCTICSKSFSQNGALKTHISSHTEERNFMCTICGVRFKQKAHLKEHMKTHTGDKPFTCPVCGKCFSRDLHIHMRIHTGERPFLCTVCGKGFVNSSNLKQHLRTHTGEKPFSCTGCGRRFSDKGALIRHLQIHTGEKPFTCTVCGKGFRLKQILNVHMKTHMGEKPFSCKICGKGFSQISLLKNHMRTRPEVHDLDK